LPLICLAPLTAYTFNIPWAAVPTLVLALLLSTPTLSVLVALGAALTVGLRRGGAIVGLLVLPLAGPLLIFGTQATDFSIHGEPTTAPLLFLGALAVLAVSLGPLAIAAAVKVGLE
jgi:heme exporter protein B